MTEHQPIQSACTDFAAKFLRDHYGESPAEITVIYQKPFLLLYLKDFLLAPEVLLMGRGEEKFVLESRNLLMESVTGEFLEGLNAAAGIQGTALFHDWNLKKKTGFLLVTTGEQGEQSSFPAPAGIDEGPIREIIEMNSALSQKKPEQTRLFWLSDFVLLVQREGILIDIEKQLIKNGLIIELGLAKRPLEYRLTKFFNLDSFLPRPVDQIFVDWDFQRDISFMVLIMEKPQP